MQIKVFKSDTVFLKVSISGNGHPALVIGSHRYYPRTFSKDLQSKLQLVCMDSRAFASDLVSHQESDFALDKIISDIERIRQSLNMGKVIIIGHSIHAFMALEYAKKYSDFVSHLILIASSPFVGSKLYKAADRYFDESVCPRRKAAYARTIERFMKSSNPSFIDRMLGFGPRLWYDYNFDASELWKEVEVNSIGSRIIWGSLFEGYGTAEALQKISCPILLALGRYDYFNPPICGRAIVIII